MFNEKTNMSKTKRGPYELLGKIVVSLMNVDNSICYKFLEHELGISSRELSALRKGEDMCVYYYVLVIGFVMDEINLEISMSVLQKCLMDVLIYHDDLVVATVPHKAHGAVQPLEHEVLLKWNGVQV